MSFTDVIYLKSDRDLIILSIIFTGGMAQKRRFQLIQEEEPFFNKDPFLTKREFHTR